MAERAKGRRPVIPLAERLEIVPQRRSSMTWSPKTVPSKVDDWHQLHFDVLFKGDDWRGTAKGEELERDFASAWRRDRLPAVHDAHVEHGAAPAPGRHRAGGPGERPCLNRHSTRPRPLRRPERESYGGTVRRLAGAQKAPAVGSPAYSRFVNRRVGRYLAAAAYHLGLTPNQVTAVSALFSLAGILLVALVEPAWWVAVTVALALALGYALDSADGQLARLRGGGSPGGEWLDHVVDCVKILALHSAVLISLYRFADLHPGWLLVPLAFLVVDSTAFFAMTLNDQLKRGRAAPEAGPVVPSLRRSLLVLPTDYGVLCLAFLLFGWPAGFLAAYGLLLAANAAYLLAALVKWYRDISALEPRRP